MQRLSHSLALGFSCLNMASATIRLCTLPVAVFGMVSVKYNCFPSGDT
jgi:hypothetical protein